MKYSIKSLILTLTLLPALAFGSVKIFNSSNTDLGHFNDIKCGSGIACTKVAGKGLISKDGGLQTQSTISGDLTLSQCGTTITSDNSVVQSLHNLPAISSSSLGCRYTFIVGVTGGPYYVQIEPNGSNKILLLTDSGGDAITADNTGESVSLEATQAGWAPIGKEQGTWTDVN